MATNNVMFAALERLFIVCLYAKLDRTEELDFRQSVNLAWKSK